MRWPIRRRWQVIKQQRIAGSISRWRDIKEQAPAPAARLYWTRVRADNEAMRLTFGLEMIGRRERFVAVRRP
jgi:hypothetical protein